MKWSGGVWVGLCVCLSGLAGRCGSGASECGSVEWVGWDGW